LIITALLSTAWQRRSLADLGRDFQRQALHGLDLAMGASTRLGFISTGGKTMQTFEVHGMSCGHCVKAVTRALQAHDAGAVVEVDLASARVNVTSQLSTEQIVAAIAEEGYDVKAL
jgi:copper chaperone